MSRTANPCFICQVQVNEFATSIGDGKGACQECDDIGKALLESYLSNGKNPLDSDCAGFAMAVFSQRCSQIMEQEDDKAIIPYFVRRHDGSCFYGPRQMELRLERWRAKFGVPTFFKGAKQIKGDWALGVVEPEPEPKQELAKVFNQIEQDDQGNVVECEPEKKTDKQEVLERRWANWNMFMGRLCYFGAFVWILYCLGVSA